MNENELGANQENRRQHPRVSGAVIEYSLVNVEASKITAFMRDLSLGGVCIYVYDSISVGDKLNLSIHVFGGEHPIQSTGEVIWRRDSGYLHSYNLGIKFIELDETNQKRLVTYIDDIHDEGKPTHPIKKHTQEGVKKFYYDSRELLSEVKVINGKEEGLKKCFYRNGNVLEEMEMSKGLPHGKRFLYYQNGKLHLEQEFTDGKILKTKRFSKDGQPILEEEVSD